jgi:soluble lytic murein transglycosylase-like protein
MSHCFEWASQRYGMSALLLQAIAQQESGLNPKALNRNSNGSTDVGLMQINTSWLPTLARHGIRPADLWDPCTNIMVGAWILGSNLVRMGPTVAALGAYNARDPVKRERYARQVLQRLGRFDPSLRPPPQPPYSR